MKKPNLLSFLLAAILAAFSVVAIAGQNGPPPDGQRPDGRMGPPPDGRMGPPSQDGQGPPNGQRPGDRGALLRELGLSKEQAQAVRRMMQARKPIMDAAQDRLHDANKALDEAIYADTLNEQDIQAKMKEAQLAQAEVVKLRFMNELEVRKVLTPEQLVKFRDLREKFERMRENRENIKDRIDDRRPQLPPQNGQPLQPVNQRPVRRPGIF
jgi:Spy/CpxP family protein refolding chaperone